MQYNNYTSKNNNKVLSAIEYAPNNHLQCNVYLFIFDLLNVAFMSLL
jgi:hypothetical protein